MSARVCGDREWTNSALARGSRFVNYDLHPAQIANGHLKRCRAQNLLLE
jgi:hypothetical protein